MDSLTQLHDEMRACTLCLDAGHAIVPGAVVRGSLGAEVMLIGQAPGVTEVEAKRPFNAGSGKRLFQWLGEAGWDEAEFRARHYMTAVTKCYPGKGGTHAVGKGDRVPSKAEQALCRPFLEREIALVRPKLMILVGGLAIKLLFPAKARLVDVVGTAVYFPPETLIDPVNFKLEDSIQLSNLQSPISTLDRNGRLVIPLPHPSGASLWPNKPANKLLIAKATQILHTVRSAWNL
jgi:uracil-DNA glycosylase